MQDDIQFLKKRVKQLPYLPDTNVFRQAQNLLLMDNLVFLEIDETDLRGSSGPFSIVVMDRDRNILLNTLAEHSSWLEVMAVPSEMSQNQEELTWQESASVFPEKSQDQDQKMLTVTHIWSTLQMAIAGKHVLTYDLTFLETFLASYIRFANLPPLGLVGTSLQDLCHLYFRPTGSFELDRICQRIDLPLPKYATVIDRVNAELSLLQAMAEGVVEKSMKNDEVNIMNHW